MKVRLNLQNHDIAAQAGWSEAAVEAMVRNYAHTSMGALERIKRAAGAHGTGTLRDATSDAEGPQTRV